MQETQTQREERKNIYISRVLAHAKGMGEIENLIEEASSKWEEHNSSLSEHSIE